MFACQMPVDNRIRYGNKLAVRAVATFYPGLTAYTWLPFVGTGGRIARFSAVFTFPTQSPYIVPPPEQSAKQRNLVVS
ncbi:hypothetical protein DSJ_23565 (plasmid) [Pantoea stewartii subsp. stewartii DC283]|uniref:Uncharacterized protein n=1 Tax=Pantoea stewartii subsp. stewartii DC283 TaxID=660596 RepID=A0ABN4ZBG9_PANSE|nr:hypothetical protein DSJ_23565 [Pantoea stewartii subsp. stewartii DC283]